MIFKVYDTKKHKASQLSCLVLLAKEYNFSLFLRGGGGA